MQKLRSGFVEELAWTGKGKNHSSVRLQWTVFLYLFYYLISLDYKEAFVCHDFFFSYHSKVKATTRAQTSERYQLFHIFLTLPPVTLDSYSM